MFEFYVQVRAGNEDRVSDNESGLTQVFDPNARLITEFLVPSAADEAVSAQPRPQPQPQPQTDTSSAATQPYRDDSNSDDAASFNGGDI